MIIRQATAKDLDQILNLFEGTIRSINSKDYADRQIDVWATAKNKEVWKDKIKEQYFYVVEKERNILGFSSIDLHGYLDFLYVHKDHQRQGIATALIVQIEKQATRLDLDRIWASVSTTAKPFFEKHGYSTIQKEDKQVKGVSFINSLMKKHFK